ncbi:MAG: Polysaccharide biosynthesis/export protein [bacterium ADurb.Bin478]|nr:MAG: Polysaccharide biosynthesis/export protein [bacterium ADurb.Bin478]
MKKYVILLLILCISAFAQERKIKAGDGIEIVVYGHQELSRVVTVSPQGTIDFPFMQNLPVDGLTLEKLREIIVAQLSRYLEDFPIVTLNFAKSNVINISIMGMVKQPGIRQLPLYSNLQGAIAAAGGTAPGAKLTEVQLMRGEPGKMVAAKYDLQAFLLDGDLKNNPMLSEGDVIMVTAGEMLNTVKVVGEVRVPGVFEEFTSATVIDMLMRAGGPTANADIKKIRYISPARKKAAEYRFNLEEYLASSGTYPNPEVKAGDIIYVPKKPESWRTYLPIVSGLSSVVISIYYIFRIQNE